ncbi:hypothetical protein FA13DRAFT_1645195 [Coprinellus micaceus]|uniref:DDE-1 domain-containing protein n=1 Tax=Coprinellus micaceus TaxID=71717 RepID=A0A4Y7SEJ4_COPMI|nr:hypothetical protein FA13DRAFT_1645195 [Coprinellus micaceus]
MVVNGIPADVIVNGDQMGVSLMLTGNQTRAPKGALQVDKFGKEEKHQFMVMVGTTCTGNMLPIQCIWSGKTSVSLPTVTARKDVEKEGHIFTPGGANHWSTLNPLPQWLDNIVIPHLKEVVHERGLKSPVGLVVIDCWQVHRSKEFLEVMKCDY